MPADETPCDVMVIGTGMAGLAAGLFAADRGLDTVQAGLAGELQFASGLLDLLGVHPVESGRVWNDPWKGLQALSHDRPEHPYARLNPELIRRAMEEFTGFLAEAGHPYHMEPDRNARLITPVGTVKTTYALPRSMFQGARAFDRGEPCLLVGFHGLKGFSARQVQETLGGAWPGLRALSVPFPGGSAGEQLGEHMARSLERPEALKAVADAIRPHLREGECVGLPAVLGITRTSQVVAGLESELAAPVFEVPTMVPSVTGLRIQEAFVEHLPRRGVLFHHQVRVSAVERTREGLFQLELGVEPPKKTVLARNVLLASGRFLGKGLRAERKRIRESLFDLPVHQPGGRASWHHRALFHKSGHPINRAGIVVDDRFRPVDETGRVLHPNLFAVGSILAHQDWIREKCGSGLAIATALAAVEACEVS